MARLASRVSDKRVLKLIRAFLNAGVMEDGLVCPVDEGTPQGGPLSPLLSNLVLGRTVCSRIKSSEWTVFDQGLPMRIL